MVQRTTKEYVWSQEVTADGTKGQILWLLIQWMNEWIKRKIVKWKRMTVKSNFQEYDISNNKDARKRRRNHIYCWNLFLPFPDLNFTPLHYTVWTAMETMGESDSTNGCSFSMQCKKLVPLTNGMHFVYFRMFIFSIPSRSVCASPLWTMNCVCVCVHVHFRLSLLTLHNFPYQKFHDKMWLQDANERS